MYHRALPAHLPHARKVQQSSPAGPQMPVSPPPESSHPSPSHKGWQRPAQIPPPPKYGYCSLSQRIAELRDHRMSRENLFQSVRVFLPLVMAYCEDFAAEN
ncbi:hypothetical protein K458DRAFT_412761 [Lentithecium fluviatile CBS 122367]|uniref:Uncharacterized protein n=1 Tax=Lentithecium fluviatile CBS 122367 TaxID=1168545 RepID=A0A6G1JIB8_9PLEO|nr:hypothetical protein K458DRAFT_412761 [Lentithecium fluviatile CBS 122367]